MLPLEVDPSDEDGAVGVGRGAAVRGRMELEWVFGGPSFAVDARAARNGWLSARDRCGGGDACRRDLLLTVGAVGVGWLLCSEKMMGGGRRLLDWGR
ncbi:hypothetical protein ACLOJK_029657 [Asimina triloba]